MDFPHRSGARLVCLHGAGGGGWEWRAWLRVFRAAGWRARAPDLAPTADGLAATTLSDYREQVPRLAGDGPVVLAGASLGGWLALAVSAQVRPVARLLVNPVPPAGVPGWPPRRREHPGVVAWGSAPDFQATRRSLPDGDHYAHRLAHRNWRDESGAVMDALQDGAPVTAHHAPTLVLAGERDADVPPAVSRTLADSLQGDFVVVPGASHLGPLLGRSAVAAAALARDWLTGVLDGAAPES